MTNPQNGCQRIETRCLQRCDKTRRAFEAAIQQTFEQMSYIEDLNVESVTATDFLPFEKEFQTVKLIQSCADQGVPVEWTVFPRKIRNSLRLQQLCNVTSSNTSSTQLLGLAWTLTARGCPLQWVSPLHRAAFYQRCLHRFDITSFKRKARSASRRLQDLAFEQKRKFTAAASKSILGGVGMILGGIISGVGIVLGPVTGGGSLSIFGAGISLGSSAAATFGHRAVKDGEEELNKLKKDSQQLSILLLLYTQSASSVSDFQDNRRAEEIAKRMIDEVEERCFKTIPMTAANEANVKKLSNAWIQKIVAERAKARVDWMEGTNIAYSEPKTTSPAVTVSRNLNLLKGPFKPILKNFLKSPFKKSVGSGFFFSAMQSGLGIYEILAGLRRLKTGLHHHIITAARRILHDTDSLIFAYSKIMGEVQVEENSLVKELYSVDLHVTNTNWGFLSGTYLTFSNGAEDCNTPQVSGWSLGWTQIRELGACKHFR